MKSISPGVECLMCGVEPPEYIQLDCGHSFCMQCILMTNSRRVMQEQYSADIPAFLIDIECHECAIHTLLDKAST